jgi:DNA polymerase III alpha subunit (gram-positive type)
MIALGYFFCNSNLNVSKSKSNKISIDKTTMEKTSMDINSFQSIISQTSKKGRDILKSLEDFKFTLEQTARLVNNNQQLAQGMITKRKSVDEISNKLYQIVFDIENMDISQAFQNQNQPVMQDAPTKNPTQQTPQNPGVPGIPPTNGQPPTIPGTPPMPNLPKKEDESKPKDNKKEDTKDKSDKDKSKNKKEDSKEESEDKE